MNRGEHMKYIFLPFAGGNSFYFYKWKRFIEDNNSKNICINIEYPGHGFKSDEDLLLKPDDLLNDIRQDLDLKDDNYILFGHSMGAYLAFLLEEFLEDKGICAKKVFLSGVMPPNYWKSNILHVESLNQNEFIQMLKDQNKINPKAALNNQYLDYIKPIIYSDFLVVQNIKKAKCNYTKLNAKVSVLNGSLDKSIDFSKVKDWKKYSKEKVDFKVYNGDHFYIDNNYEKICELIMQ